MCVYKPTANVSRSQQSSAVVDVVVDDVVVVDDDVVVVAAAVVLLFVLFFRGLSVYLSTFEPQRKTAVFLLGRNVLAHALLRHSEKQ